MEKFAEHWYVNYINNIVEFSIDFLIVTNNESLYAYHIFKLRYIVIRMKLSYQVIKSIKI